MKTKTLLIIFLSFFAFSILSSAPTTINYQGLITDSNGDPIVSSTNLVTVNLYATESDTSYLYTQSFTNVISDSNGIYSIQIGDTSLRPILAANDEIWLELIINLETLSPRQEVNAVPYALHAESANQLIGASDSSISGSLSVNGAGTFSDLYVSGNGSVNYLNASYGVFIGELTVPTPSAGFHAATKDYVDAAINMETTSRSMSDAAIQADVDQNEAIANAAIANNATAIITEVSARQASEMQLADNIAIETARAQGAEAIIQADVDQNEADSDSATTYLQSQIDLNPARGLINYVFEGPIYLGSATLSSGASYQSSSVAGLEAGDRILLIAQTDESENGIYEIVFSELGQGYLNRADDFDSEEEMSLGDFVFVESGATVHGYVLDQRAGNFVLDDTSNGAIGFSRFTVDTTEQVNFSQGIVADNISGNSINVGGAMVMGDMAVHDHFQAGGDTTLNNASISGTLNVANDADLNDLEIHGDTIAMGSVLFDDMVTFNRQVTMNQGLTLAGQIASSGATIHGNTMILGSLDVDHSTTIGGDLIVSGTSDLPGANIGVMNAQNATVSGAITANNLTVHTFEVTGSQVSENLTGNGVIDFTGASTVRVASPIVAAEAANKGYVDAAVAIETASAQAADAAIQADVDANEVASNDSATAIQVDVDQNEVDADAAIADLQAQLDADTKIILATHAFAQNYSFNTFSSYNPQTLSYEDSTYISYNNPSNHADTNYLAVGDTILFTAQSYEHTNGLYEVVNSSYSSIYIERVESLNESLEYSDGHIIFILEGDNTGYGYFLNPVGDNFVLGGNYYDNRDINYTLFTIDLTQDTEFEGSVTASRLRVNAGGSSIDFNGYNNEIITDLYNTTEFSGGGDVRFFGGNVQFQDAGYNSIVDISTPLSVNNTATFGSSVSVPTPTVNNEAANKEYVDLVGNALTTAISDEVNRATVAESALTTAISDEVNRAQSAEAALATNIAAGDTGLDQNIQAEAATRLAADLALETDYETQITNEAATRLAADLALENGYIGYSNNMRLALEQSLDNYEAIVDAWQKVAVKAPVKRVFDWHQSNLSSISWWDAEVGDRTLLSSQSPSSQNGIYVVQSKSGNNVSLIRASDFDSVDEIYTGAFVFDGSLSGSSGGQGYVLTNIGTNFQLGTDAIDFRRFTALANAYGETDIEGVLNVEELRVGYNITINPYSNYIDSYHGTTFGGSGVVDFETDVEFDYSVSVPTPVSVEEAANKGYVDSVVVPTGGLVAWSSASSIPPGWSNAGLTSPMPNYIWIKKD